MELINEAFILLNALGLSNSQSAFSRIWLRQSAGYFAYLKSSGSKPCLESIACLSQKLMETSSLFARLSPLTERQQALRTRMFDLGMKLSLSVVSEAIARRAYKPRADDDSSRSQNRTSGRPGGQ